MDSGPEDLAGQILAEALAASQAEYRVMSLFTIRKAVSRADRATIAERTA
jgi:hypothetical protein